MAVRDRGSTGWLVVWSISSLSFSVPLESERTRLSPLSARWRLAVCEFGNTILLRLRVEAWWARGRWSMPTLKSHNSRRQSSPTLPNRYVFWSQRHGSNATEDTQELWPWHLATILRSGNDQIVKRSSWPPVTMYLPSGDQQTQISPP